MTTQTTPSRAKWLPSYAAVELITNAPPWIHTMTGNPAAPGSGVQTLRSRQSSPVSAVSQSDPAAAGGATCGGDAPYLVASRTPSQGCTGRGGGGRRPPGGGAAPGT